MKKLLFAALAAMGAVAEGDDAVRVMLPRSYVPTVRSTQAIDRAAWVWHPTADGYTNRFLTCSCRDKLKYFPSGWTTNAFLRFRNEFRVEGDRARTVRCHISADERFALVVDGELVARGPHRSTVGHWAYQSYDLTLKPGEHRIDAVVWRVGPSAPTAQLSWQGGFVFAAEEGGKIVDALTTGRPGSRWKVSSLSRPDRMCWAWGAAFTGGSYRYAGKCPFWNTYPEETFVEPVTVLPARPERIGYGLKEPGWELEPSPLPDQLSVFRSAGEVKAIKRTPSGSPFVAEEEAKDSEIAAWNDFLAGRTKTFVVPPNTYRRLYCNLGDYVTGFPEVETGDAASGSIHLGLQERGYWPDPPKGEKQKPHPDRNRIVGLSVPGWSGGVGYSLESNQVYSAFWWGAGKWLVVNVQSGAQPLVLKRLGVREDRYPLAYEGSFGCDDRGLDDVQRICVRTMQMCAHEAMMDCPAYEQQMYPGDTRVQLLAQSLMTRDDRMIRRAIELFDWSRGTDGLVRMNYPCWMSQNSASYTLCWLLMLKDYALWHDDVAWLRARVPGMRQTMSAFELWEDEDGLLTEMPYWNFMDWAQYGTEGGNVAALMDLFHLLAMDSVAFVERALGNAAQAAYWEGKVARKRPAVLARYWSEKRGLIASSDARGGRVDRDMWAWTEHAQVLAILAGVLDEAKTARVMGTITRSDEDLRAKDGIGFGRCSVYFSHYLFEAFKRVGRTDLTFARFDLWRDYVRQGLSTCVESPGTNARSDCHAWGSHPVYQLHSAFAGVEPAAPFFAKVRVAPQPAGMRFIRAKTPHPKGFVETDLRFEGGAAKGTVTLPEGVSGAFVWKGREQPLKSGANDVDMR